jgi:hypothetical protein
MASYNTLDIGQNYFGPDDVGAKSSLQEWTDHSLVAPAIHIDYH